MGTCYFCRLDPHFSDFYIKRLLWVHNDRLPVSLGTDNGIQCVAVHNPGDGFHKGAHSVPKYVLSSSVHGTAGGSMWTQGGGRWALAAQGPPFEHVMAHRQTGTSVPPEP